MLDRVREEFHVPRSLAVPDERRPARQVRASFDEGTVTVYQAYSPVIAGPALEAQRFIPPFSLNRMTWIKPSFLWMMYRSGWATKPGQERVLAIKITRLGFESALAGACLSHFDPSVYGDELEWRQRKSETSVRVQWDPERDVNGHPLPWRSLQVGLSGDAAAMYVQEWIVSIDDLTRVVEGLRGSRPPARDALPQERAYPLPTAIAAVTGASPRGADAS